MESEASVIEIEGPQSLLDGILGIEGLAIDGHGQRPIGNGAWRIPARANDAAIAELRKRGLTVRVVRSAEEMRQHLLDLARQRDGG